MREISPGFNKGSLTITEAVRPRRDDAEVRIQLSTGEEWVTDTTNFKMNEDI